MILQLLYHFTLSLPELSAITLHFILPASRYLQRIQIEKNIVEDIKHQIARQTTR